MHQIKFNQCEILINVIKKIAEASQNSPNQV
jgi:hypothetical protein